jgi:hypothetical protein
MMLLQAKSAAAMAVADGVLGVLRSELKERYTEEFGTVQLSLQNLLRQVSFHMTMVKDMQDAPLVAFLLQLMMLNDAIRGFYFTYTRGSSRLKIADNDLNSLYTAIVHMICNLDKDPTQTKSKNGITTSTTVDAVYVQMLQDFGFTPDQSARACTAPP